MTVFFVFILIVVVFLLFFLSNIFFKKNSNRNAPLGIGLVLLLFVLLIPGYFIWTIYDYSNPSKWHEIILPLNGHLKGDSNKVEFLLPKQKYIVLISFDDLENLNQEEELKVRYRVSIQGRGVIVEDVQTINRFNMSHHEKRFQIDENRTEGELFAEIISPSLNKMKVKVALSTDIFL